MKIGISLLCHNDEQFLRPCLGSLFKSDLMMHDVKLFCFDNNSNQELKNYLTELTVDKWIHNSETNEGIVIPRIKIYEEIKKDSFDFLLEIHSDMVFPKVWLTPLLELFDKDTGILEPHIYQPSNNNNITLSEFELKLPELLNDKIYNKCRQTHPWLINLNIIDKIGGYYDEKFSPHECEDDDFIYRVIKNNLTVKSSGKSWVVHYGGVIRHNALPSNLTKNKRYFHTKHGITVETLAQQFEIHPAYVG